MKTIEVNCITGEVKARIIPAEEEAIIIAKSEALKTQNDKNADKFNKEILISKKMRDLALAALKQEDPSVWKDYE